MSYNGVETLATHNGAVTVENPATGEHRTFHIRTIAKDSNWAPGRRVVELRRGPEWDDRTTFGFIRQDGSIQVWRKYQSAPWTVYAKLLTNPAPFVAKGAVYLFEGRCRVCNRTLTNPDSIRSGIGPVCAGR